VLPHSCPLLTFPLQGVELNKACREEGEKGRGGRLVNYRRTERPGELSIRGVRKKLFTYLRSSRRWCPHADSKERVRNCRIRCRTGDKTRGNICMASKEDAIAEIAAAVERGESFLDDYRAGR
jgi:hypothetical protein